MNRLTIPLAAALLVLAGCESTPKAEPETASEPVAATDDRAYLSYGVGFNLGREVRDGLAADGIDADLQIIVDGFVDGIDGSVPKVDQATLDAVLVAVNRRMQEKMVERMLVEDEDFRALHDANLARSRAMIAAFQRIDDVRTLEEGIHYRVLGTGTGISPGPGDGVVVSFVATNGDGEAVLEAEEHQIQVSGMRPGPFKVIQQMREGDRWEILFAPETLFGAVGQPPLIGPNETLLFDVVLHKVIEEDMP